MAQTTKDKHYWAQLRAALTAGQWNSPSPAKAPNGAALSWSELFRKFNKHCRGFEDVAEVASQTQALALLLGADSKTEDDDDARTPSDNPIVLGDECVLPQERIEEANVGYEILKKLQASNFDTLNFALAYYAYALGRPAECLSHLSNVPDLSHVGSHIPSVGTTRSNAASLQVPESTTDTSSSSWAGSIESSDSSSVAEIKDGRAWSLTEIFRSICLQGMSHEELSPTEPQKALNAYCIALPLLNIAESENAFVFPAGSTPTTSGSGKIDFVSFKRFRELWRWAERLIWRAIVLSAKISDLILDGERGSVWRWLSHYTTCSAYWPPAFRTDHRSAILTLYLRALILRARNSTVPYLSKSSARSPDPSKPPAWLHTARSVVYEYRSILSVSTCFPRAGERNVKVEEFVDLCVAVWEASGAVGDYAGWVIDVLWWATRLTFNSYRIFRHMTRLLHASGDTELSIRTLRLYVQVVSKAYLAGGTGISGDADSPERWVETLVQGARMLCRVALNSPGLAGLHEAREAGLLIEKARSRLDFNNKRLVSSVDLAEAIWSSVMALKEQEPRTRSDRFLHSHNLLLRSVSEFPTPSGHYHLALSLCRAGASQDLAEAVEIAGLAVEGEPREIRYWHLLGLLLAANERWKDAKEILEQGADVGEVDLTEEEAETPTTQNGVAEKDLGFVGLNGMSDGNGINRNYRTNGLPNGDSHNTALDQQPVFLLGQEDFEIPVAADLLNWLNDHPPPSRQEVFEHALQLRMTQAVLAEYVEGVESAADRWVEVFSWIAEKRGSVVEPRSMDGVRLSAELKAPSELLTSPAGTSAVPPTENIDSTTEPAEKHSETLFSFTVHPAVPDDHQSNHPTITEKMNPLKPRFRTRRRSTSSLEPDKSKGKRIQQGKKVQQMLKNRVHKGQARITHISKKIGNGVVRTGTLRRFSSAPDFHVILQQTHYQASSIHSRRRLSSIKASDTTPADSPPPPPPPNLPPIEPTTRRNSQTAKENTLLSDLWLMSAATFRRLGKIEQAKGAIQEAEVRDENNPAVWVQLGLYHTALGHEQHAIDAFQKALFIMPDDISANIHLCRIYLTMSSPKRPADAGVDPENVDLAVGMLSHLTRGAGWDVPEAWYFLAKGYGLQDRKDKERECLSVALKLSENRGLRDIPTAVGWCL